jgi:type I restriction enzyme S subunit
MSDLPKGWLYTSLMDIVNLHDNQRIPLNQKQRLERKGSYPYYGANGQVDSINDFIFDGNYILLAEDGGYFDDPSRGVAYEVCGKFWVNNHAHILSPCNQISTRFLTYFLNIINWMEYVGGSTRLKLTQEGMKRVIIPLPPLAEQKRIVTKLDNLFAHTRRARQELDHIPKLIERYKQAILSAAFRGDLTADWRKENPNIETAAELLIRIYKEKLQKYEEKSKKSKKIVLSNDKDYVIESWKYTTLETIAEEIVDCPHSTPKWVKDGFICVRTTQFERFKLKMDNLRYVSQETFQERILRLKPQAGDILYSREGGILGIACQIPPNVELCLGQRMMLIRCNDNWLSGEYLTMLLNSEIILSKVKDLITGTASPHLNVGDVKSFEIPLPPVLEQQEIIKRVNNYFQAIDRLEQEYQKAMKFLDRLEQSTLAKAFRGKIVPQDPNDEPASILLERIQKERENQPKPKKRQLSLFKEK